MNTRLTIEALREDWPLRVQGRSLNPMRWWDRLSAGRTFFVGVGLLALFLAFMAAVQFSTPNLVGNDGYYHIKLVSLMRTEGLKPHFDWLPLTILNAREFVNHHFLYHVLLIPFTLGDLVTGAKLASVLYPSLAFLAFWWLLHKQRVPYAPLWAMALLVVSEAFLYRMSMPRVQALSLGVLVLSLHWLLTERHTRLIPLAFFYVWLYDAFPLIILVTGAYAAAVWMMEGRLRWRPVAYAGLGVALGLLINPYFPDNLIFIYRHIVPKLTDATAISVGSEWFPYNTAQLMENSGGALLAFLAGVVGLGLSRRRMEARTATLLLLSIAFGFMLFKSRRFIEYLPAFALLFAAFAWAPTLRAWRLGRIIRIPVHSSNSSGSRSRLAQPTQRPLWIALAMAALLPALWLNLQASRESVGRSKPYQRYAEAASWLAHNTPEGARVFQTDWDDFPRLFFHNSHNTYMVGLDPSYMQLYDAGLYEVWTDISKGRVELPSAEIRDTFGAAYVLTDLKHTGFLREAEEDPALLEVHRDEYAAIFEVLPDRGAPDG